MSNHENAPKLESNQAILAHVKEEMDAPRMSEPARVQEEMTQPEHGAAVRKAAIHHPKEQNRREAE
jgi:Na+-transporting methylmalonyl-CoA/oxaloacetate decarboxylase gamma subunit